MFLVGELGATINADRKPFDRTLDSVFRDGGRMMRNLGATITKALTLPLAGAGVLAIKTAADYEKLETSMAVLNGSVEEGARNFQRLQEFSARTPFQLKDLAQAQNMLQGFGLAADDAFDSIAMIGDIAAVSGGSIQDIGIAFGQAAAEGRLMTRDIRQLINQGVPAIKLLADTMGVAQSEVLDLASEGKISFEILQQSFRDATSEGGMFANGMEKQSKTISGLFSTLKDNVSLALGDIGESLVDTFDIRGLISDLTGYIQEGISWFNSLSDETRRMAFTIAGLLGIGGPVLIAIGALTSALGSIGSAISVLFNPITLLVGLFALVSIATQNVIDNFDNMAIETRNKMREMQIAVLGAVKEIGDSLLDIATATAPFNNGVSAMVALVTNNFRSMTSGVKSQIAQLYTEMEDTSGYVSFGQSAKNLGGLLKDELGLAIDLLIDMLPDFEVELKKAKDAIDDVGESSNSAVDELNNMMNFFSALDNIATMSFDNMKKKAIEMSNALQSTLTKSISSFAETLGNAFTGDAGASGFFNNLLTIVADFASAFGKALIGAGIAAQAFQKLLINPIGAIIAGTALVATAAAVKNLLADGPAGFRSNGGSTVAGNSYVVGENGREIFTPSTNGTVTPIRSGGMNLTASQVESAFSKALSKHIRAVSDRKIFEMAEQGRYR